MSFFDLKNDKYTVKDEVVYDYRNVSIYSSDVSKRTTNSNNKSGPVEETPINGKRIPVKNAYYSISFPNKSPNLTYSKINPSSYTATHLYLFGLLHNNIQDISVSTDNVVGELVIEHTTNQPPNRKIYTCFLLKRSSADSNNDIDKLVEIANGTYQGNSGVDIDLNQTIPRQTDIFYYDGIANDKVFIFTVPIEINSKTADFIQQQLSVSTTMFKTFAPNNTVHIQLETKVETFVGGTLREGIDNDVYIDCQPTGESDETIQAYSIPINSEYSGAKGTIDFMRSAVNLLMFLIISIVAYFMLPPIYKKIVIDKINTQYPGNTETRLQNISYADTSIMLILVGYVLYSFAIGIASEGNVGFIYIGFAMSVITAAMYSIIQVKKVDLEFMSTMVDKTQVSSKNADPKNPLTVNLMGVFSFLATLVMTLIGTEKHRNNFFVLWLFIFVVIAVILKTMIFKSLDRSYAKEGGEQTLTGWFIPMLILNTLILAPTTYLTIY
jgi:hypothetical protein